MNDFTAVLYKLIGRRIHTQRTNAKIKQLDLIPNNRSMVSILEHGMVNPKKNPSYFLSSCYINEICSYPAMKLTPGKLVWGSDNEKKDLIKLWTVSLLLNGTTNPFVNNTIDNWIENQWMHCTAQERKAINAVITQKVNEYVFFISPEHHSSYFLLKAKFDKSYQNISHLILKQLMHDYDFSKHFIEHVVNYNRNVSILNLPRNTGATRPIKRLIENLILGKDSYCDLILDMNGICYPQFISAFEKFWSNAVTVYMPFFEKNLFLNDDELLQNGLNNINNKKIHDLFCSEEFIELNEKLLLLPEYTESEAILSSFNVRMTLGKAVINARVQDHNCDMKFAAHFNQIIEAVQNEIKEYYHSNEEIDEL